ncbi:alpha/beta hydrolase [uncultured Kordia sp.]|uniref:alpha/beta hydrolase n=1 Tax=uncultured Kordia sp. TaxID=507699 RepID=UPI00261ED575|nr:alpha/beta hydrolase [uncultured Kordia sp.]
MKQSLTYYLMLLVMKLKGLKKSFSQDPIDYKKIRKEDVYHPKGSFFKQNIIRSFNISKSLITEIGKKENTSKLLIFVHGGAFISGPGQHHWDTIKEISKQTDYTIWMCNYPKAPEHKISEISENIDLIYNRALKEYQPNQISFIGGSVGGTLITALMQRLIAKKKQLPHKIILVSPVMDASMSNPDIDKVDQVDPMLSKVGLVSAKKMCAQDNDLKNVLMSPIYGSFEEFPETILFIAEHDVTYPDQKILVEKLKQTNTKITVITGKNMPHIWPFLPVMKEAKIALHELIQTLTNK